MNIYFGQRIFNAKIRNFPQESYRLTADTHLYKYLRALLAENGVGSLQRQQTIAWLASELSGIRFEDLDLIFGSVFSFHRLPSEMYDFNPFVDALTTDEWDEVMVKDSSYRERIKKFTQSLLRGGTNEGIALVAEAACGHPCQVLEMWRNSATLGLSGTTGRTNTAKEFIVVPKTTTLTGTDRRAIYKAVNRLKPANTICTVDENGLAFQSAINIRRVISDSEYFEIRKYVTGVNVPPAPVKDKYFWIQDGVEVEMPSLAHLQSMESSWSVNRNITSMASFKFDPNLSSYKQFPQGIQNESKSWGIWRRVEVVDSPDNYPNGKYPGDPNKYNSAGNYVFTWTSQSAYLSWFTTVINQLGGEISGDQYRLPQSLEVIPGAASSPWDALAVPEISVTSGFYGV